MQKVGFQPHFLPLCQNFLKDECKKLGLKDFKLIELNDTTLGQAHTVMLGLQNTKIADNEEILIFNIDTFRPNFTLPQDLEFNEIDGYLEVFEADGENWSFVLPGDDNIVLKTTEKERISSLCSSGLYYFKKAIDFKNTFGYMIKNSQTSKGEYYIAPMYNYLIAKNKIIKYHKISLNEIIFCGTPQEYELAKNIFSY